jgi:adenylate kinase
MENIILIAPAGAGKGTQAQFLKDKYNMPNISIGELLRNVAVSGSELGKHIGELQKVGILVEDETTLKVLLERLEEPDCANGFVLDGYPRNLKQAIMFDKMTRGTNKEISTVILLEVPKDMLLQRITGRVTCKVCGEIFNEYFDKIEAAGHCNKCGGELFKRDDDNEESFNRRYNTFLTSVQEAIEFYKEKGILHVIDASIGKDHTFSQIENIVNGVKE